MSDSAPNFPRRLLIQASIAAVLVIAVVLAMANSIRVNMREEVRHDRGKQMEVILDFAQGVIQRQVGEAMHAVESWARHDEIMEIVPKLLAVPSNSPEAKAIISTLNSQLVTGMQLHGLRDYRILERDYTIRASLDPQLIGQKTVIGQFSELLADAWRGQAVHTPLVIINAQERRAAYFVAAPIPDAKGLPRALLVFKVDAIRALSQALPLARRGESGETYAFNADGMLLSPVRFEPELRAKGLLPPNESSVLRLRIAVPGDSPEAGPGPLTEAATQAVRGGRGQQVVGYPDYRGVPVIGAWRWLPELGFGLVTEIDSAEAYGFLYRGRVVLALFVGIIIACVLALIGFMYRSARRLANSEAQLQQANENLELRVTERTSELQILQVEVEQRLLFQSTLMESLPTPVFVRDQQARLTACNRAYESAFGIRREQSMGRTLAEIMPMSDEERASIEADTARVLSEGKTIRQEVRRHNAQGQSRHYMLWLSPLRDMAGGISGLIGAMVDVTDRVTAEQQVREQAAKLEAGSTLQRAILANAGYSIIATDPQGLIRLFNPAAERMLGYSAAEMVGRQTLAFVHDPQEMAARATALSRELGQPLDPGFEVFVIKSRSLPADENDWTYIRRDGSRIPVRLRVSALRSDDGTITGFLGIALDLTDTNKREQALRAATTAAESAARAKSEFLAVMSHEIRTPMNGVVGMADLLAQTPLDLEQERMLATIRESANALLTILNDILDFSKIEAGKMSLEALPTSLRDTCDRITETLGLHAARKGLRLISRVAPQTPRGLVTDPVRVRQIMTNLLSNAIKFTEKGSVRLDIAPIERSEGRCHIRISVRDEGIGMSEAQQAALFQPFLQAESSTTRRYGGTGLGLSIVRRLTELMGGTITVRSAVGLGSTFSVDLPMALTDRDPSPDPLHLNGVCILVLSPDREAGELAASHCRDAQGDAAVFSSAEVLEPALHQVLQAGTNMVVVYLGHSLSENSMLDCVQQWSMLAAAADLRFVAERRFDSDGVRHPRVVAFKADPLTRSGLLDALGIACGRASPPVRQPIAQEQVPGAAESAEAAAASGRLILVAEDNPTNQEVIRRQLALLGYAADITNDGAEALAALVSGRYACLLTDCHMPVMDGYELARRVRQSTHPDLASLPIVAITANALQGEADRCREAGMDYYLSKPLDLRKLRKLLNDLLPPPADTAETEQEQPPFNPDTLRELIGEEEGPVRDILSGFAVPAQACRDAILSAIQAEDAKAAGLEAHKLKSSARAIGAVHLARLCADLEQSGKSGRLPECAALCDALGVELDRVLRAVDLYLG